MRVFVDTNVLLDVYLHRPGRLASLHVLTGCVKPGNEGWIAWHSLSNGFYIVRRTTKLISEAQRFAFELLQGLSVATVGTIEAQAAVNLKMNDLEDAMQIIAAQACHADIIVTRNVSDFGAARVPVLTPEDFLLQFPGF